MFKKLSVAVMTIYFLSNLSGCNPEEQVSEKTETQETTSSKAVSSKEPTPIPTPISFNKYDIKSLYKEIVSLESSYAKAHTSRDIALRDKILSQQKSLYDKYSKEPLTIHPVNPISDCWGAISRFDAANEMARFNQDQEDDERWAKIVQDNYKEYKNAIEECKLSSETGLSKFVRESKNNSDTEIWDCNLNGKQIICSAKKKPN